MQIQTERGLIFVEKFVRTSDEAKALEAEYSFTSHDIDCDCYSVVRGTINQRVFYPVVKSDADAVRLVLWQLYKKSSIIKENFKDEIISEICNIIAGHELTEQSVMEAALCVYMLKTDDV